MDPKEALQRIVGGKLTGLTWLRWGHGPNELTEREAGPVELEINNRDFWLFSEENYGQRLVVQKHRKPFEFDTNDLGEEFTKNFGRRIRCSMDNETPFTSVVGTRIKTIQPYSRDSHLAGAELKFDNGCFSILAGFDDCWLRWGQFEWDDESLLIDERWEEIEPGI